MFESLLDNILATAEPAHITQEEHNPQNINTGSRDEDLQKRIASIRSGSWDASEYRMTKEAFIAELVAADTPEARAKVEADLRIRALNRASLDTSNNRVNAAFAGRPAWHGLGVVVNRPMRSLEARTLAGLDWQTIKKNHFYDTPTGEKVDPHSFALVRSDTNALLGRCGTGYRPIHNEDGFDFLDETLAEFDARYESAGSLFGGKKAWMLVRLPNQDFDIAKGDLVQSYALFTLDHTGHGVNRCLPTTCRIECANTMRVACRNDQTGIKLSHRGDISKKISEARRVLGLSVTSIDQFRAISQEMTKVKVNVRHYASDVLDAVLDITEAQMHHKNDVLEATIAITNITRELARKEFDRKVERRGEILEDIFERYETDRCRPKGTLRAAFDAVTEHADHNRIAKQSKNPELRASRRFQSTLMGGAADQMKQEAYLQASEMVMLNA